MVFDVSKVSSFMLLYYTLRMAITIVPVVSSRHGTMSSKIFMMHCLSNCLSDTDVKRDTWKTHSPDKSMTKASHESL